jgi:hypothetical protein
MTEKTKYSIDEARKEISSCIGSDCCLDCPSDYALNFAIRGLDALENEPNLIAKITRLQSELQAQTERVEQGYKVYDKMESLTFENAHLKECVEKAEQRADRAEKIAEAAIEDMVYLAGNETNGAKCNYCKWNPNDMGCELDGSQFDDDGECHFEWRGEENKGEA